MYAESERLGGKNDVDVKVKCRRRRTPLPTDLCPELCCEP